MDFYTACKVCDLDYINANISKCNERTRECGFRYAAMFGHYDLVNRFIQKHKVNPRCANDLALVWAAMNGHLEIVSLLFDEYGLNTVSAALIQAADNGHLDVVKYLIEVAGADSHVAVYVGDIIVPDVAIKYAQLQGYNNIVRYLTSN